MTSVSQGDLGAHLGSGGVKDVFEYGEHKAIALVRRDKRQGQEGWAGSRATYERELWELQKEVKAQTILRDQGLPTVNGQIIEVDGRPALLMDRYAQGSKDLVKTIDDRPQIKESGDASLLNQKSIDDLRDIKETMISQQIWVNDLQFLIARDGSIVIADAIAAEVGRKPSKKNLRTIDRMIELAEKNL